MNEKLQQKLEQEMKDFKDEIREKGVDYALDRTYELAAKQEIIDSLYYDNSLSNIQERALLSRVCLLDELYDDWLGFDGNMRQDINFSIDKSLNYITGEYKESLKKKKDIER